MPRFYFTWRGLALFLVYLSALGNCQSSPEPADKMGGGKTYGSSAVYSVQRKQDNSEHRFVIDEKIDDTGISLLAIFDGDHGKLAAKSAKKTLIPSLSKKIVEAWKIMQKPERKSKKILESAECSTDPKKEDKQGPQTHPAKCYVTKKDTIDFDRMINDEVLAFDHELLQTLKKHKDESKTRALIVILHGTILTVAHVGDTRGVMLDLKGFALPMYYLHTPNAYRELCRIYEAGGTVQLQPDKQHKGKTVFRVKESRVSRCLGGYLIKGDNIVIATPDILKFDLAQKKPKLIILASYGVWDNFTNKDAVAFIEQHLKEPDFGAKSLVEETIKKKFDDDVTAIVIRFKDGKYRIN